MKFKLEITLDNAAFADNQAIEVGYILAQLGKRRYNDERFFEGGNLMDHNENKVGTWEVVNHD